MSEAKKRIEILAPVGSPETLEAAVYAGADSVYLGLQGFNARRGAGNFTPEELKSAVRLCHAHGVQVHVTLNTLVHAAELPAVQQALRTICEAGADAVLVQDWAVAGLVRACAPGLRMHASTQLAVYDLDGALQAAEAGFSRVVLARELSGSEIAHITAHCGIETEAFIHGAQCMSVSGQCYLSAFLGGRSGNRGGCAQPCRLPCQAFAGASPVRSAQPADIHHLSLKDMSALAHLPALEAMGVASVKIEGRLRPPEYVAGAVHAARLARDGLPYDVQLLEQVFSRSGFTDSYYTGDRGREMFGMRRAEDLAVTRAAAPKLRELYRRPLQRVPVDLALSLDAEGAKLTADDGTERAAAYAEWSCTDETPGAGYPDTVRRSLGKTGGTPFAVRHIALQGETQYFLPPAQINELRRTALDSLYEKRAARHTVPWQTWTLPAFALGRQEDGTPFPVPTDPGEKDEYGRRRLVGRFESPRQLPKGIDVLYYRMIFPLRCAAELMTDETVSWKSKLILELPRGSFGSSEKLAARVRQARELGFSRFEATNIGHLHLLREAGVTAANGCEVWGGWTLNVLNPLAAAAVKELGVTTQTVSCEVRANELAAFAGCGVRTGLIAYGRLPVMLTRACPLQNVTDCDSCPKKGRLLDRKGEQLPVICRGSVREIYNPVPLWMGERQDECTCDLLELYFTWETPDRVRTVTELFRAGAPFDERFTRGLYYLPED